MTKPEKSAEPSMEDILASIRKIIADDPAKSDADGSAGLLSGAGSAGNGGSPAARAAPAGISINPEVSSALDSLLDDAVDDPPATAKPVASTAATTPDRSNGTGPGGRPTTPSPTPATTASPAADTPTRVRLSANPLPELKPSIDRMKFDTPGGDRPSYPSLGGSLAARAPATSSTPGARPTELSRSSLPPAFEEMLAQRTVAPHFPAAGRPVAEARPIDLGSPVPASPAPKGATAAPVAPPPSSPGDRNGEMTPGVSATPAPTPSPKLAGEVNVSATRSTPVAEPPVIRQTVAKVALTPASAPPPTSGSTGLAKAAASDKNASGSAAPDMKAREPAKDATMGGGIPAAGRSAAPGPLANASMPAAAASIGAALTTAPAADGPLPQPAVSQGQMKTLEDTLAEVVRPLVRQWVIENMPRIIEEVAKQEVAKLPKPDA